MTRQGRSDDLSGQRGEDARAAATRLGRRRLGLLLATGMSNWTTGRSLVEGPAGGGRRRGLLLATGTSSWMTGRILAEAPTGGGRRRRRMGLLLVWTSSWRRRGLLLAWMRCPGGRQRGTFVRFHLVGDFSQRQLFWNGRSGFLCNCAIE